MSVPRSIILVTNKFPFKGGEPFLESEIDFLAAVFDNIWIFPLESHDEELLVMPDNVNVVLWKPAEKTKLKTILVRHGFRIAGLFLKEFIISPKRFKYLSEFKFNFYRVVGLINDAEILVKELKPLLEKTNNKIYSYWFNDNVSRLVLTRWFGLKLEIVTRVHLYDFEEEFNSRGYLPFRYSEMKLVKQVVPISEYARTYLKKRFKGLNNITDVCRLGAKPGKFNPGNTGEEWRIVTCSSLTWYKRPLLLSDLMASFKGKIHWVHFGSGNMKDAFLEKASGLPDNIKFDYMGHVSNSEILEYYNNQGVDVLLNVSNFEGIPFSMIEAIAAGIPVIGCNICGVPELVCKETGLLLNNEPNPKDTAIQIRYFLERKARNLEFRMGVKSFWEMKYNAYNNYIQFIKIITNE